MTSLATSDDLHKRSWYRKHGSPGLKKLTRCPVFNQNRIFWFAECPFPPRCSNGELIRSEWCDSCTQLPGPLKRFCSVALIMGYYNVITIKSPLSHARQGDLTLYLSIWIRLPLYMLWYSPMESTSPRESARRSHSLVRFVQR